MTLREVIALARGYAVPDSEAHINQLACAVVLLAEEVERLKDPLAPASPASAGKPQGDRNA